MTFNRTRDDIRIHSHRNRYEGGPIYASALVGDDGGPITILASSEFEDDEFYILGSANVTKRMRFEVDGLTANTTRTLTVQDASYTLAGINLAQSWSALQSFPDNLLNIVGSGDATKIARFEVDGITTATTRTLTVQNASYTLAGIDLAQSWSAVQSFPDNLFNIVGSADATKKVAFEVDGVTIGTTRTLTVRDASYTLVGATLTQTWTALQTFSDTTFRIVGNFDATKELVFECDSATTGTQTRINSTSAANSDFEFPKAPTGVVIVWHAPAAGVLPVAGSLLYGGSATTSMEELVIGGSTRILTSSGAAPQWSLNSDVVDMARAWSTVQQFKDNAIKIIDNLDTSKTLEFELSNANGSTALITRSWCTSSRFHELPDANGTIVAWNAGGTGILPVAGSLLYGTGTTDSMTGLTIGASGTILTSTGSAPQWSTVAAVVDQARSWTTLQTFPDNTFKIVGSASANRTLVFEVDAASANADLILNWAGTADRTNTFPDATTTLAGLAIAQTFTKAQVIAPDTDVVGLTVTQNAGATADFQVWESSVSGDISKVDLNGTGHFSDASGLGLALVLYNGIIGNPSGTFSAVNLSANRTFTLPDASGSLLLGGVSATLVGGTSSTLASNTLSNGASFIDNTTSTKRLRMVLSGGTGNNSFTFTNATRAMNFGFRDYSGTVPIVGDDPPGVAAGSLGKVDLTAQTANIATTNLSNGPTAGLYLVEVVLECTTSAVAAGTLAVTIGWTDTVGATTDATSITAFPLTATGRTSATYRLQVASAEITYAVTVTGIYSTAAYAIYARVISLA